MSLQASYKPKIRHVEDDLDDSIDSEDCTDDDDILVSIAINIQSFNYCYFKILFARNVRLLDIPRTKWFMNFAPIFFGQPKLPRGNLKNSLKICPAYYLHSTYIPMHHMLHDALLLHTLYSLHEAVLLHGTHY